MGSVYKRGNIYWIAYYRNGRLFRESSRSSIEREAKDLLKLREGEVVSGEFAGLKPQRVRFDELADDLVNEYKVNNRKSLDRTELSIKHLEAFFGGMRAVQITSSRVKAYINHRKEEKAANATINKELSALKRMFNLALQETPPKVRRKPHIPRLDERNVRKGYFERDEYLAVKGNLSFVHKLAAVLGLHLRMAQG